MANWSLPTLSDLYTNFRAYLSARLDDVAKMFDSALVSATNLPTGTKRWNSTASKWEKWDGSAWSPMATTYGISISGNAATASKASGLTPGVALGNIGVNGLSYAYMQDISATQRVLGRNSAGAGDPQEISLSQLLDWVGTCAQGDILYRGATGWARLAAGTNGRFLKTQGAGANPIWAAVAVPTVASTAEAKAGTENTKFLTALRLREGLNAAGSAPVYACRAWVQFQSNPSVSPRAGGNVTSVTDLGTGYFRINFTTPMPHANYAVAGMSSGGSASNERMVFIPESNPPTTSACWVRVSSGEGSAGDALYNTVMIFC